MFVTNQPDLALLPAWQALLSHRDANAARPLRQRLAHPQRFARLSRKLGGLLVDFSKQNVGEDTLELLLALAHARDLAGGIAALAEGESVNVTERRAALHIALRAQADATRHQINGINVMPDVLAARQSLGEWVRTLRAGQVFGATGQPITHVVNLGIGGSDLGPRMVTRALSHGGDSPLRVSFVATPDPLELDTILAQSEPSQTLFLVSSKSFSTVETLANADAARSWLKARLGDHCPLTPHFRAITNNVDAALSWGIPPAQCLSIPDWVGGRFSLWSAIGLPVALAHGMEAFEALLAGARSMDDHFLTTPFQDNLPVLMALIGLWNVSFLGIPTLAVLPYSHALVLLPDYLQQLEMESNGKSVNKGGRPLGVPSAPVIWGSAGPLGQHAFHQLLFQGNLSAAVDFVLPVEADHPARNLMVTQALAQSGALALGKTVEEAESELRSRGVATDEAARLAPHIACHGNVPNTTLMLPGLNAFTLGQLIALYEHKVFVQGWLWGINSFDQFGVEFGKVMARGIACGHHAESSTQGLWTYAQELTGRDSTAR